MFLLIDRRGINPDQILGWEDDGGTLILHMTNPAPRGSFTFANSSRVALLAYLTTKALDVSEWHELMRKEDAELEARRVEEQHNASLLHDCTHDEGHVWDYEERDGYCVCTRCGACSPTTDIRRTMRDFGGVTAFALPEPGS